MADIDGNSNIDPKDMKDLEAKEYEYNKRRKVFKRTMEFQYWAKKHYNKHPAYDGMYTGEKQLQQKWVNELGEEEWRDIPLVISE